MLILQYSHLHKYLFCVQFIIRYLHIFFTVMFSLKTFIVAVFTLFDLNSSADCLYAIQLYIRFQTRYSIGNNASFENVFKSVKDFSDNLQVSKTRFEKKKKWPFTPFCRLNRRHFPYSSNLRIVFGATVRIARYYITFGFGRNGRARQGVLLFRESN